MATNPDRCTFDHSSALTVATYNREAKVLSLWFKNGGAYYYTGVNEGVFRALIGADSAGHYFTSYIRPFYKGTRIL